jgi:hypothetical protein
MDDCSTKKYLSVPRPTSRLVENIVYLFGSDLSDQLVIAEKEPSPSLHLREARTEHSVCSAIPHR